MTGKKTQETAGRRPSVDECIEAWWRLTDSPPGRILPERPRGEPGDTNLLCSAFDTYCWRLVVQALSACKTKGIPATRLSQLLAHIERGGEFKDFHVYDRIQIEPDDPNGWKSTGRQVTEVDRMGIDEAWIAKAAYARFRHVLKRTILHAQPYIRPPRL